MPPTILAPDWAKPLSSAEMARAEQVARRMHAALVAMVEALPPRTRKASAMARELGVVRNTCQRIVATLRDGGEPALSLTGLPGVQGLRLFVDGFRRAGGGETEIESALAAIAEFERFVKQTAGSMSKLSARLEATKSPADGDSASELARQRLFASAAEVMGRQCDADVSLFLYRPIPGVANSLERVRVRGQIGQIARAGAMPYAIYIGDTRSDDPNAPLDPYESLDAGPLKGDSVLLKPFCSTPMPLVTVRSSDDRIIHVIDYEGEQQDKPVDIVVGNRRRHHTTQPGTNEQADLDSVWALVDHPTRRLLFDVYLHKAIEREFRLRLDVQLWGPKLHVHPADTWFTRFPHDARLQLLGSGISAARSDAYSRHAELTSYAFECAGWDPNDFVGFRCEQAFPIWRSGYCMCFERASDD